MSRRVKFSVATIDSNTAGNVKRVLPVDLFRMTGSQKFGREGWCNECKNRNQRVRYADAGATREYWQELLRGIL